MPSLRPRLTYWSYSTRFGHQLKSNTGSRTWQVEVRHKGKRLKLTVFCSEEEAAVLLAKIKWINGGKKNLPPRFSALLSEADRAALHGVSLEELCEPYQSKQRGTSRHHSVYWHQNAKKWTASIWAKTTQNPQLHEHHIGSYDDEEDAAMARDLAALAWHGRDAKLNLDFAEYSDAFEKWTPGQRIHDIIFRGPDGQGAGLPDAEEELAQPAADAERPGESKFRGVLSYRGEWIAQIFADGKETKLGSFATEEEAARSYDEAAREAMRRPGARSRRVNFPRKGELPALREASEEPAGQAGAAAAAHAAVGAACVAPGASL